jgi:hypothetical protein
MPFERGRSGNPAGGPVGSRHRQQLNGEFIAALLRDFRHGGPKAIERVRRTQPAAYLKILALLVPRELEVSHTNLIKGMSTEQIEAAIAAIEEMLAKREAKIVDVTPAKAKGCFPHASRAGAVSGKPLGPAEGVPSLPAPPPDPSLCSAAYRKRRQPAGLQWKAIKRAQALTGG